MKNTSVPARNTFEVIPTPNHTISIGAHSDARHAIKCQQEWIAEFSDETPACQQDAQRDA